MTLVKYWLASGSLEATTAAMEGFMPRSAGEAWVTSAPMNMT
jgi:hypothetical protein